MLRDGTEFQYWTMVNVKRANGAKPDESSKMVFRHCVVAGGGEWSCHASPVVVK